MRLAVASGKGGTGKTLVATNLAWHLADSGRAVTFVDTDVEAPNGHLFLHPRDLVESRLTVPFPVLRDGACSGCGECQEACAFNAIIALPDRVMVFPELCHACGGCLLACGEQALTETQREMGTLRRGHGSGVAFWDAVLDVGEAKAPPLIKGLLDAMDTEERTDDELVIMDAPPGISCNAVTTVRGADRVLLVTEPTPFGLHDLELAVAMCRTLDLPVAAVINRSDVGDGQVRGWLEQESIPLLAEIPLSREVAGAYVNGDLAARVVPSFHQRVEEVARSVMEESW